MNLLDEDGEIRESYGYDEFGLLLTSTIKENPYSQSDTVSMTQPFGFTSYQKEEVGGLYFAQARRYDADTGRFISEDKLKGNIEEPQTLNSYIYCWNNPIILVDLDGLRPMFAEELEEIRSTDEGKEAHKKLQEYLKGHVSGVEAEKSIPHSSILGNTGYADLVYTANGMTEIYEIKKITYLCPEIINGLIPDPRSQRYLNNLSGKAQLQRYIDHYWETGRVGKEENKYRVSAGTSLFLYIFMMPDIQSDYYKDKMIRYYVFPNEPGMIYWSYVSKEQPKSESVYVLEYVERKETVEAKEWEVVAIGVLGLAYIALKILAVPATGGLSLCAP